MCAVEVIDDAAEHRLVFLGHGVADGVRQIDDRGARFDCRFDGLTQKINVGAAGVFGGKFHFRAALARVAHVGGNGFEGLFARQAQLVAQVQIGSCKKRVQARMRRAGDAVERRRQYRRAGRAPERPRCSCGFRGPLRVCLRGRQREAMGKPASMMSTPSDSSCRAMRIFSAMVMENPGDCSPSLSVVSKILTLSMDVRCTPTLS